MRLTIAFLLFLSSVAAQTRPAAEVLPTGFVRHAYYHQLRPPAPGTPPWHWRLVRGALPPGITLGANGVVAGAPTGAGEFHFSLEATDSSPKPVLDTREYILPVPSPLTVVWTQPPRVTAEGAINGELQVSNGSGGMLDLTIIVLAVNTVNKAFALGYQRLSLAPGVQRIPFGSTLPRDSYVVHADAIAEFTETGEIYRARRQTDPLTVP